MSSSEQSSGSLRSSDCTSSFAVLIGFSINDVAGSPSAKRLFQARALRREQFRAAVFGDVHIVFQAHPKLAADINARFITKRHARFERGFVAAHQIWPFVDIHADAVADAVREVLVIAAVAGISDYFA